MDSGCFELEAAPVAAAVAAVGGSEHQLLVAWQEAFAMKTVGAVAPNRGVDAGHVHGVCEPC